MAETQRERARRHAKDICNLPSVIEAITDNVENAMIDGYNAESGFLLAKIKMLKKLVNARNKQIRALREQIKGYEEVNKMLGIKE